MSEAKPQAALARPSATEAAEAAAATIDRLYRRHHRDVFRLALRYGLGDAAWAEDVVQDVFITLVDALDRLGDHDELGGWLYRVTTHRCLRKLRRERFLRLPVVRWLLEAAQPPRSLEGQIFARHDLERARRILEGLPPRERVVVSMVHLDGRSQREVCETLGLSKGYVSRLLARGVARIQEGLDE
ncbi:MAG: sigma-70 family RNA polymerase sigma factor [Nannocystaceae bacterium]